MIKKDHLYLLDFLKFFTLISITIFHVNEFIYFTDIFPANNNSLLFWGSSFFARVFALGGQVLVMITYFLFGYSRKSKISFFKIFLFTILGQSTLGLIFGSLEWDIYSYVGVSNLLIIAIPYFFRKNKIVTAFSIFTLLMPQNIFNFYFPDFSFSWIISEKLFDFNSGSWPLFPWFFLALLFYQAGLFAKDNIRLKIITSSEIVLWIILSFFSLPFLGAYFWVPIGPNYYHFVFNQQPHIFWSNALVFIFILRLSLLKTVQKKINNKLIFQFISNLYWIRQTGPTYLLSLVYLGFGMRLSFYFSDDPILFDLFFVFLMPICELSSRPVVYLIKTISQKISG
jgi:hypothetical protein